MKVLLIKDVKGLGKAGEIKEVKDGYGNNFLIGKGLAQSATTDVLRKFEAQKKKEAEELRYEIKTLNSLKEDIEKSGVKITKPLGANGSLFGSITKDEISNAIKEQRNIEIDKKSIEADHIKAVGLYDVNIKLKHGIHATLKLDVVGE